MAMIDKNNPRLKYLKGDSTKKTEVLPVEIQTTEQRTKNMHRLLRYKAMWDAMAQFRRRRIRIKDYERGRQWNDVIKVDGKEMTEGAHIMEQGKVPLKNNVILQTQNSIVGEFRNNYTAPEAVARTREYQIPSEMMTGMLQLVSQLNEVKELDVADFAEAMRGGLTMQMVDYQWDDKIQKNAMKLTSWNPSRIILPSNLEDVRGNDIESVGVLMDMTVDEVVQRFAHTAKDEERIREIYKNVNKDMLMRYYSSFMNFNNASDNMDFACCRDEGKCRVIQMWELESECGYLVHDYFNATLEFYPKKDLAAINAMIAEREADIKANGYDYEKMKIEKQDFVRRYWYVRYLSPFGDSLLEMETPFNHKSHPFAIYMARLVDGEIFSLEESIIDQQRYINRLITLIDFIIGSSAKGVLVFPENAIPKGMDKEDILEQWTSYRGVIFANLKPGMQVPTQISTNATNVGANELLAMQLQLIRDISGTHGAMMGKEAKSGTAASQYAQEATNARTNIIDMIESFNAYRKRRDYLICKTLPQCYDKDDIIPVVGREFSEDAKIWDSKLMAKLDYYITISNSLNTEIYEAKLNELLTAALQQQMIDFETALEAGRYPFADKILRILRQRKQEAQVQMAQQQAAQMQGQAQGLQMQADGASQADVLQAGANAINNALQQNPQETQELEEQAAQANPRAMQLIQQALS